MATKQVKRLLTHFCRRCGYEWTPRVPLPALCPKCKSRFWYEARPGDHGRAKGAS